MYLLFIINIKISGIYEQKQAESHWGPEREIKIEVLALSEKGAISCCLYFRSIPIVLSPFFSLFSVG